MSRAVARVWSLLFAMHPVSCCQKPRSFARHWNIACRYPVFAILFTGVAVAEIGQKAAIKVSGLTAREHIFMNTLQALTLIEYGGVFFSYYWSEVTEKGILAFGACIKNREIGQRLVAWFSGEQHDQCGANQE